MSSLTVALAILGGLVLAAVIAYNAWTSRRNTPRQPRQVPDAEGGAPTAPQPMGQGDGDEPVLHVDPPMDASADRHEPLFDPDLPAPTALAGGTVERRGGLDALIDVIAPIALDGIVSGDAALAAMPATRRAGSKPVAIEGLNDANTERYAKLVTAMSRETQFLFISHNKIAMEMAEQLIGVTMQEQGVSRIVAVDMEAAASMVEAAVSYTHLTLPTILLV